MKKINILDESYSEVIFNTINSSNKIFKMDLVSIDNLNCKLEIRKELFLGRLLCIGIFNQKILEDLILISLSGYEKELDIALVLLCTHNKHTNLVQLYKFLEKILRKQDIKKIITVPNTKDNYLIKNLRELEYIKLAKLDQYYVFERRIKKC